MQSSLRKRTTSPNNRPFSDSHPRPIRPPVLRLFHCCSTSARMSLHPSSPPLPPRLARHCKRGSRRAADPSARPITPPSPLYAVVQKPERSPARCPGVRTRSSPRLSVCGGTPSEPSVSPSGPPPPLPPRRSLTATQRMALKRPGSAGGSTASGDTVSSRAKAEEEPERNAEQHLPPKNENRDTNQGIRRHRKASDASPVKRPCGESNVDSQSPTARRRSPRVISSRRTSPGGRRSRENSEKRGKSTLQSLPPAARLSAYSVLNRMVQQQQEQQEIASPTASLNSSKGSPTGRTSSETESCKAEPRTPPKNRRAAAGRMRGTPITPPKGQLTPPRTRQQAVGQRKLTKVRLPSRDNRRWTSVMAVATAL